MCDKKGVTLVELLVVLVIMVIFATISTTYFMNYQGHGAADNAQKNLVIIYGVEWSYYFQHGFFCTPGNPINPNPDCSTLTNINSGLSLNITDPNYSYSCVDPNDATDGHNGSSFQCTAQNIGHPAFTLIVNGGTAGTSPSAAIPIVLPGAVTCGTPQPQPCTPPVCKCNPVCNDPGPNPTGLCPTPSW